ncbi:hypothetical protein [Legionella quinlivanii]|uniref:hypothetical protein n=1 Tax=Legionella quinlivanii TaxID=45073 RepID=UPI00224425A3|nr:hypothetical protein [Legionella quinlivanii]MCW8449899.1 hypothetical protein [Legionella quinlivanii]
MPQRKTAKNIASQQLTSSLEELIELLKRAKVKPPEELTTYAQQISSITGQEKDFEKNVEALRNVLFSLQDRVQIGNLSHFPKDNALLYELNTQITLALTSLEKIEVEATSFFRQQMRDLKQAKFLELKNFVVGADFNKSGKGIFGIAITPTHIKEMQKATDFEGLQAIARRALAKDSPNRAPHVANIYKAIAESKNPEEVKDKYQELQEPGSNLQFR